jgi:hypothetical protein
MLTNIPVQRTSPFPHVELDTRPVWPAALLGDSLQIFEGNLPGLVIIKEAKGLVAAIRSHQKR